MTDIENLADPSTVLEYQIEKDSLSDTGLDYDNE